MIRIIASLSMVLVPSLAVRTAPFITPSTCPLTRISLKYLEYKESSTNTTRASTLFLIFCVLFCLSDPQSFRSISVLDHKGLKLSGPTHFAEIIKEANGRARQLAALGDDVQAYLILLILTDGEINDMEATKQAIMASSHLPMSIIIVGVGNADFGAMNELDGDDVAFSSDSGTAPSKDIVQFVPFRDFVGLPVSELAASVLAEIPGQFVSYMKSRNIKPRPPISPQEMAAFQAKREQMQQNLISTYGSLQPTFVVQQPGSASPMQ